MASRNGIIYEFGDFRLVPGEGLLLHKGEPVPLSLKNFSTLVLLVEKNGHLVSKSELLDTVWADAFVEEAALSRCIWSIRHALGDNSKESFIRTVPRRGYRFVSPVTVLNAPADILSEPPTTVSTGYRLPILAELDEDAGHDPAQRFAANAESGSAATSRDSATSKVPRRKLFSSFGFVGGLILVALVTTVTAYFYFGLVEISVLDSKSVAVLPFKAVNANDRDEFFELGVADALVHRLGASKKLVVRPFAATRRYTDAEKDPVDAGRELRVNYVVDATYQRNAGKIRVSARMIDVASGIVESTYRTEANESSAFGLQELIAEDIGKALLVRLTGGSATAIAWRGTDNEDAYRHYLQGMNLSEERGVQNVQKALEHLQQAVALDPNYATAWAGVAHLHRDMVGHSDADAKEHYEKSMEAVAKALAIDPNLADAYSARCANKNRYEYDHEGAEVDCKRAIELDPSSPLARTVYGNFLYTRGRFDEAIAEVKAAISLQPVSYRNQQVLGLALHFARRYPEAEAQFKRLLELNPNHSYIHGRLVKILEEQGRYDEAFEYQIDKLTLDKVDPSIIARFKNAYAEAGWRGVVMERIRMEESAPNRRAFSLACLNARIGNRERAFQYLEQAYSERSFLMPTLRVDPQLDPIRDDPRFSDLIRRVEGVK